MVVLRKGIFQASSAQPGLCQDIISSSPLTPGCLCGLVWGALAPVTCGLLWLADLPSGDVTLHSPSCLPACLPVSLWLCRIYWGWRGGGLRVKLGSLLSPHA